MCSDGGEDDGIDEDDDDGGDHLMVFWWRDTKQLPMLQDLLSLHLAF